MQRFIVFAALAAGSLAACSAQASTAIPAANPGQNQASDATGSRNMRTARVLYVADLDGQPGVGQIHVYTAGMKRPALIRNITNGTGRPFGLFVDAKNVLYVANEPNKYPASVTEFQPGASSPFFTISRFKGEPQSVAVDTAGNVYVNESYMSEGWVEEFAPGSQTAKIAMDTGVGGYALTPGSMAFDPKGNLLVAESAKLKFHILMLRRGTSYFAPVNLDLDGNDLSGPGMGVDKAGNIYVASGQSDVVAVFAPGQQEPSRVISSVPGYGMSWITPSGALYQASGGSAVTEVAAGSNSPTYSLECACSVQGVAVSR